MEILCSTISIKSIPWSAIFKVKSIWLMRYHLLHQWNTFLSSQFCDRQGIWCTEQSHQSINPFILSSFSYKLNYSFGGYFTLLLIPLAQQGKRFMDIINKWSSQNERNYIVFFYLNMIIICLNNTFLKFDCLCKDGTAILMHL